MTTGYVGPNNQWVSVADTAANSNGDKKVGLADLIAGENQQSNVLEGGAHATPVAVAATGQVGAAGARVLYGVNCITAGTLASVHDNTSAAGTQLVGSIAMTAGQSLTFPAGMKCALGVFATVTSGTYTFLIK